MGRDGVVQELRAGTVWVNTYDNFDAAAPFGGMLEPYETFIRYSCDQSTNDTRWLFV
jgi:hypothetical protein